MPGPSNLNADFFAFVFVNDEVNGGGCGGVETIADTTADDDNADVDYWRRRCARFTPRNNEKIVNCSLTK